MRTPKICAVITGNDPSAIDNVAPSADLFEVRIDRIGKSWHRLVPQLKKPWIACDRSASQGHKEKIAGLLTAIKLGASMVDIDMETPDLAKAVRQIKPKAQCIISFHNWQETPSLDDMKAIVRQQIAAGADLCKIVPTAQQPEDNFTVLELIAAFPHTRMVAFAMGPLGLASRILCPLAGGDFTYASIGPGKESAPGQPTVSDLKKIYDRLTK